MEAVEIIWNWKWIWPISVNGGSRNQIENEYDQYPLMEAVEIKLKLKYFELIIEGTM